MRYVDTGYPAPRARPRGPERRARSSMHSEQPTLLLTVTRNTPPTRLSTAPQVEPHLAHALAIVRAHPCSAQRAAPCTRARPERGLLSPAISGASAHRGLRLDRQWHCHCVNAQWHHHQAVRVCKTHAHAHTPPRMLLTTACDHGASSSSMPDGSIKRPLACSRCHMLSSASKTSSLRVSHSSQLPRAICHTCSHWSRCARACARTC